MTTFMDQVAAAAIELARGGRWERAIGLLDAAHEEVRTEPDGTHARIAMAAVEVALEQDWWVGTDTARERLQTAEKAGAQGWQLDFLRLRKDYLDLIHPAGGRFQPGPWGKDPDTIARLEHQGKQLRRTAPGAAEAGWAEMYLGLIADNLRADRKAAPAHYEKALAAAAHDGLLAWEALRHLGDHDHDRGQHTAALDRWRRATTLGAGAGTVPGTLSQQLLLAVLARDAGDEAAATAVATEVAHGAQALGATRIRDNANGFLSGTDPTAAPANTSGRS